MNLKNTVESRDGSPMDPLAVPLTGSHLVEAGAGTGKTWQLTSLYLRLLVEKDFPVDRICAVTFTRAATCELSGRIRARLALLRDAYKGRGHGGDPVVEVLSKTHAKDGPGRVDRALKHFDEAAIHTIHGFCSRVLAAAAFESGAALGVGLEAETGEYVMRAAEDWFRKNFYNAEPEFLLYAKSKAINPRHFAYLLNQYMSHNRIMVEGRNERPELGALSSFKESMALVENAWASGREEIATLLRAAAGEARLYANIYKPSIVENMIEEMDACLEGVQPFFPLFDRFEKFTSNKLSVSVKKGMAPVEHPFFDLCQRAWAEAESLENQCKRLVEYLDTQFLAFADDFLKKAKARNNVQFYNDLVSSLAVALEGPHGKSVADAVGSRFDCALIDEFQDTDPDQYAIFQALFADQGKPLFLIGDPKQAIYAFRGADVFSYLAAAKAASSVHTLNVNRRSDPPLIDAVNAVFQRSPGKGDGKPTPVAPFVLPDIGFCPAKAAGDVERPVLTLPETCPPLEIWLHDPGKNNIVNKGEADIRLADALAARITQLLAWGRTGMARIGDEPLGERHIAVLVRGHAEARLVEAALRTAGVHCVRRSTENLFYSREAGEMLTLVSALVRPGDQEALRAALSTGIMGRTCSDLGHLLEDAEAFGRVTQAFRSWRALWAKRGFAPVFRAIMRAENVFPRLLALVDGERRVTNLLHLAEKISDAEREKVLGPAAVAGWLFRAVTGREAGGDELELRLESDLDAVKIVTVHLSKGLEYPIVFSPFLFAGIKTGFPRVFHDPARNGKLVMSLLETCDDFFLKKEVLAENVRLAYVALTRARNFCSFSWGPLKGAGDSALAWLFHGPLEEGDEALALWLGQAKDRLKDVKIKEIEAALLPVVEASKNTVRLCGPPQGVVPLPPARGGKAGPISRRKFEGAIDRAFKVTSYSALASSGETSDDAPEYADGAWFEWNFPAMEEREGPADIHDFPKGADAGQFFHDLLEHWDFSEKDPVLLSAHVADRLKAHGFSEDWTGAVTEMTTRLVSTPLSPRFPGLVLSGVGLSKRVNEMEFTFPLSAITPQKLARAFEGSEISSRVPEKLENLGFSETGGFVHGFMDMVFEHGGKYFLVDWKSNHLGRRTEDYSQEALCEAMSAHRYALQYHLYVLALHRHLGRCIKNYHYDSHFGGVFYVFLRGVAPGFGVFEDRPPAEMVLALEKALMGEPFGIKGERGIS